MSPFTNCRANDAEFTPTVDLILGHCSFTDEYTRFSVHLVKAQVFGEILLNAYLEVGKVLHNIKVVYGSAVVHLV